MDTPAEPPAGRGPFSTEVGGLHYLWRGWGPGWEATTLRVYDSDSEEWTLQPTTGSPPPGLYDGGCISLGDYLYCFGGYNRLSWFNDLDRLNLNTFQWSKVCVGNDPSSSPIRKYGCGLVAIDEKTLGCFGGFGIGPIQTGSTFTRNSQFSDGSGWTNEFHLFDMQEGVWSSPRLEGQRPPPCAYFSLTKVDQHRAVLFGGSGPGRTRVNNIYLFNFVNMEVTRMEPVPGKPWPLERSGHTACCLNYGDDHPALLMFGGVDSNHGVLGDMWILDVDSVEWTEVTPSEYESVKPRHLHSTTATSLGPGLSEALVFGGYLEWPIVSPIAETTLLRFERSPPVTGPPTEKWALVDVAHTSTRGSGQRLKEKRKKIKQANRHASQSLRTALHSSEDRVRSLKQQMEALKHWAQNAEQRATEAIRQKNTVQRQEEVAQHRLSLAERHCEDVKRQLAVREDRLREALQANEETEQEVVKAEKRIQETQHLLEDALSRKLYIQRREQTAQSLLEVALHQKQELEQTLSEVVHHNQVIQLQMEETLEQKQVIEYQLEGKTRELAAHRTDIWKIPSSQVSTTRTIGSGGWGEVLEGTVKVAVKRLHIAILNRRNLERLQRETRLLAEVRHPNLVQFIGAVFDQSPPLIVTELLDINLRQAYEQNQLGAGDRLSIFMDIARALDYLHQRYEPIIHRDVSAPNVLLQRMPDNQWKGKVSDLGSANFLESAQTMGEGAILYSPPEMIPRPFSLDMEPPPQTGKIDVYSYGIVVCEVTASQFPSRENFTEIFRNVKEHHPRVYELIIECTKRDPRDRPSMAEVIVSLDKMMPF